MARQYRVTMITGSGSKYEQIVTANNKVEAKRIAKPLPSYINYDAWSSGYCYSRGKTFVDRA